MTQKILTKSQCNDLYKIINNTTDLLSIMLDYCKHNEGEESISPLPTLILKIDREVNQIRKMLDE